jgi:steroid 5-alpha reductase family enzyme
MKVLPLIFYAWMGMALMMCFLYFAARATKNAGIVDAGWAIGLAILALMYAWVGPGYLPRRVILGALGGFWALRLGLYLLFDRVIGKPEDGRYLSLREKWGDKADRNFFLFFQAQATWDILFSLPFLAVAFNPKAPLGFFDYLGVFTWLTAVAGESIADRQLARFRKDESNRGKVCNVGLWRYSRHPNYFFEWVHWFGYIFLSIGSPLLWIALLGPVVMGVFLFKITGIPYTEQQALKSRGDAYRKYQETTSVFIPWFPKKEKT